MGDRRAPADVLARAIPEVYRYAIRLTGGDRAGAEDLVQESLLAAMRASSADPSAVLDVGWLIVVARRRFLDQLRRSEREQRHGWTLATDDTSEPDWDAIGAGEALRALGALPADQRAALVFRYVDDLPVRDVAALLDRSVAATESLLARGRRALAKQLEGARHG